MWIMLNNKPLDISKIQGVSKVITLDSKYFVEEKLKDANNLYYKSEVDFDKLDLPKELKMTPWGTLCEDAKKDNKVWGYFFYIRELVAVQHFSGHAANGVNFEIKKEILKSVFNTASCPDGLRTLPVRNKQYHQQSSQNRNLRIA